MRAPFFSLQVPSARPGRRVAARDVVEAVLAEVRAGHLPAGGRLPPVRVLERQLGLSKNTVQAAYDELVARGALETREREGVFVAKGPLAKPFVEPKYQPSAPRLRPVPAVFRKPPPAKAISLSTVLIDPELLPRERIADCIRSVLKVPGLQTLYDYQGHPSLRELIAARLRARGMSVDAREVITTSGSQQALDMIARALEIRRVGLENPVYAHARSLFESHSLELTALPIDPFGSLPLERWEPLIDRSRPGLVYAITSFQNPTGYSYATHELVSLLELSERYGFALLEDDWGSDMLSDSEVRPTLRALGGEQVLYVNSFTKKLLPSLRVGFIVAPEALVPTLVAQKRLSTLGSPWVPEAALAEFLDRGYYDTHLGELHEALDARYHQCLEVLRELMPEGVRWTTPGGGPTLWLDFPREVELSALAAALLARGVFVEDADSAFFGEPHLNGFRVSYAFLDEATLRRALEIVAEETRRALGA
ncbi:MAG TPA: PLP-dependent aminotransferase family protein [Polyangiaceae bacterium]|jgi:GntR family transcriptional regulator/MocR family aminotransferase|nr:PLP-dependent aminotransferase family protein [Polyangiaceae bacterium]